MSLKNKLGSIWKQATDYLEQNNIKEKVFDVKNKTMDKIKNIDNPEHYQAPEGFTCFPVPVAQSIPDIPNTMELLEPFALKEKNKMGDAYIRLLSLLKENETIVDAITASMKKTYLIVWTNFDRLLLIEKEHYKVFTREEMHTFKLVKTTPFGLIFSLNEYQMTGTEKSKTYRFIRNYCHENTPPYPFQPYISISPTMNYYDRFKYETLVKENDATKENQYVVKLFEPFEFPLVSIYATYFDKTYIIVLSTHQKIYLINEESYTIITISEIKEIGLFGQGIIRSEFYMDNYYFTKCGPDQNVTTLIQCIKEKETYEMKKQEFIKEHEILLQFPFLGATSYQTPGKEEITISEFKTHFLIRHGFSQKMYLKHDFDHYELLLDSSISKDDLWWKNKEATLLTSDAALAAYERARIRIFIKNEPDAILELPLSLIKKVAYKEIEQVDKPGVETVQSLLRQLDALKEGQK